MSAISDVVRGVSMKNERSARGPSAMLEPLEGRQLLSGAPVLPNVRPSDMVVRWNGIMCDVVRTDIAQAGPTRAARNFAVVELAVFDAVNGIDGHYQPYLVHQSAPKGSDKQAAAAEAAYEALVRTYPQQKGFLDQKLAESLNDLDADKGRAHQAQLNGVHYGKLVADQILAARAGDGSDAMVQYQPIDAPGKWTPDPLNPTQTAWGPGQGDVTPFSMISTTQFAPPPPPALNSKQYTEAFNEAKSLGAKNSKTRTAEQTLTGHFWAYDHVGMGSPLVLYNQILRTVAQQRHNTLVQNARLFALADMAEGDAGIAAWNCKFTDNFWRPITAIRDAANDGNPATVADPNWTPLGAPGDGVVPNFTPPFPSYISGHATFGAALFSTLTHFYGSDKMHFTIKSDELPGVTRTFDSFSQAARENGRSRVYLGIHWNFDDVQGRATGDKVAGYVFSHELKPR